MSDVLAETISALRRRYGPMALRRGEEAVPAGRWWATGVPGVDALTGGGGLPCGRVSVLAGRPRGASGRLSILQALAARATTSMQVAYVDLVGTLDPGFLADLGADLRSCLVLRPTGGGVARGLAMARSLVRAGIPWLGVALPPRPGRPEAWEHALAALAATVEERDAVTCVAAALPLPAPLAHASSLTVECAFQGWQEAHGDVVGLRVRLDVVKSKVGVPGASTALLVRYPRPQAPADLVGLPALLGAGDRGAGVAESSERAPLRLPALAG